MPVMAASIRGTIGPAGTYEKDVTIAMARQVKARMEATGRYKVVLTRDADIFVPLRERVAIARNAGAEMFISLHADAIATAPRAAARSTPCRRSPPTKRPNRSPPRKTRPT